MRRWAWAAFGLLCALALVARPTRPESRRASLALLGDVMLGRGVAEANADGNWAGALSALAPCLTEADLALANLESPLTDAPQLAPGFDLRAPPAASSALEAAGLDLISLANNHALDAGVRGVSDTRNALAAAGLASLEAGHAPLWRTVNGLRLAFLAYEDVTAPLDIEDAAMQVALARAAGGAVVVAIHWGDEYRAGPTERQQAIAQMLADAGASLIWGHHPHVLERLDWVQGAGRSRPALVAYSLGNALFDQVAPPDALRGALLRVTLDRQGVESVGALPFEIDVRHGRVRAAGESTAAAVQARLWDAASWGTEVCRR